MQETTCEFCPDPVEPGTEHAKYTHSHKDCIEQEHARRFANYVRRTPDAKLAETGRKRHWGLGDIVVTWVTDPVNQIPRERRFCTGLRGGEVRPDGTRTPFVALVIDRWELEAPMACASQFEAQQRARLLNNPEAVVTAVDPALAALVGSGVLG